MKNYQEIKIKVLNNMVRDEMLFSISKLKLAKDWKYSVSQQVLSPVEHEIFCKAENISNPRESWIGEGQKRKIISFVQERAFENTKFSNRKNFKRGSNKPEKIKESKFVSHETIHYKGAYKRYTGYMQQSDFSVLFHRTKKQVMYNHEGLKSPVIVDLSAHERDFFPAFVHELTGQKIVDNLYHASSFNFRGLPFKYDKIENSWSYRGFDYHLTNYFFTEKSKNEVERNIVKSFQKRKKEFIDNKTLMSKAEKVMVKIEDSIKSGNCAHGTDVFRKNLISDGIIEEDQESINGKLLLSIRNDSYTRRAVNQAIKSQL